ncbi:hypothetical protein [Myxococcus sp. RHSTA-1-4]|uniref:hypothetical protein n=1 Tax=Myxococcus sp. RHSTA-1-4 TaxID=2874601 RepID=UPI001CBBEE62|nr:hypothetical protein [Myxococcus sp. RHSTA-1-4]MBZ4422235.1 hypothetical protein [Myxococcus sp. RHSTA-1-4]
MGEQDRALHEIADARARLSELADELARKAEPDRLKAMAQEKAGELKVRAKEFATEKAGELKQHAKDAAVGKATELKTHAKETVMQRTTELKERADTPKGWSLLGALIGAGVGSALMRKAFTVREERWSEGERYAPRYGRYREDRWREEDDRWRYEGLRSESPGMRYSEEDRYESAARGDIGQGAGTRYGGVSGYGDVSSRGIGTSPVESEGGMKERAGEAMSSVKEHASDVAHTVKDRAMDMKERASGKASEVRERAVGAVGHLRERASHMRERIPSRDVMRNRTSDWFTRTVDEQPILLALGGIALGMLASTLIPVSNKERRFMEPAKRRAEEGISQLGDQLNQKLQGHEERAYGYEGRQDTSDLGTSASTDTGFGASSISTPSSPSGLGAAGTSGVSVAGTEDDADALASSPSSSSRIPPLPPLDDVTKVH